jgi:hypothetical protein
MMSSAIYPTGIPFGQGGWYVSIGGKSAELVNAFNLGGFAQFDVRIPSDILTNPSVPVLVQIAGTSSQTGVTIAVQDARQNATDTSIVWVTAVTTDPAGNVYFVSSYRERAKSVTTLPLTSSPNAAAKTVNKYKSILIVPTRFKARSTTRGDPLTAP